MNTFSGSISQSERMRARQAKRLPFTAVRQRSTARVKVHGTEHAGKDEPRYASTRSAIAVSWSTYGHYLSQMARAIRVRSTSLVSAESASM